MTAKNVEDLRKHNVNARELHVSQNEPPSLDILIDPAQAEAYNQLVREERMKDPSKGIEGGF